MARDFGFWILLACTGEGTILDVDKYNVMHRVQIHGIYRQILDPLVSYPSTISSDPRPSGIVSINYIGSRRSYCSQFEGEFRFPLLFLLHSSIFMCSIICRLRRKTIEKEKHLKLWKRQRKKMLPLYSILIKVNFIIAKNLKNKEEEEYIHMLFFIVISICFFKLIFYECK